MNEASSARPANVDRDPGERISAGRQLSEGAAAGCGDTSFSGEDGPILRRVFRKLCDLSDTLEEIEGWIEARSENESRIYLPSSVKAHQIEVTPENLDTLIAAERDAIVEKRESLARLSHETP